MVAEQASDFGNTNSTAALLAMIHSSPDRCVNLVAALKVAQGVTRHNIGRCSRERTRGSFA